MSKLKLLVVLQLVASCVIVAPLVADADTDLSVESLTVDKSIVNVLEPLKVSAHVRNGGNIGLKDVVVRLSFIRSVGLPALPGANPPKVLEDYSVNLPPNSDIHLTWTTFLPVGTHDIVVTADPNHTIEESNEQNNVRTHQVIVEPIPLSEEAIQHIRKAFGSKAPGDKLGPFVVLKPIRADLYPGLPGYMGRYIQVDLRNFGPDTLPREVLDLVTVTLEFIGAPTDHICTAPIPGKSLNPSNLTTIDFYTGSTGPCPRALVEIVPCDETADLSFMCSVLPDLRISINLPTSQEPYYYYGYFLIDPKPYNNVRLVKAGKH